MTCTPLLIRVAFGRTLFPLCCNVGWRINNLNEGSYHEGYGRVWFMYFVLTRVARSRLLLFSLHQRLRTQAAAVSPILYLRNFAY